MAHEMTTEEIRAFLLGEPARTGKLALVRQDGQPIVVPIWFDLDGDDLLFTTAHDNVKGKILRRDPRLALCVDDERPPFAFVTLHGEASFEDDPEALLRWATRIGGRYMGADRAEEYGRRNAVPEEMLVRVRVTRMRGERGVAD